jgi:hypothetical protein
MATIWSGVYKPPEASGLSGVTTGVGGTGVFSAVGIAVGKAVGPSVDNPEGVGGISVFGDGLNGVKSPQAVKTIVAIVPLTSFPKKALLLIFFGSLSGIII